jgi:Uma2 family endonuclease
MSSALPKPWTTDQFLAWAEIQDMRYEFDGTAPVAMTGGTVNHGLIMRNLHRALDARLRSGKCVPLGPDVGLATVGTKIRYPDALITCSQLSGASRTVPGVVIVFEIVSPGSGQTDRIIKVGEYAAVPSIRRYIIIESTTTGLLALHRPESTDHWAAAALTIDDVLSLPEIGIEVPVQEFYDGVAFGDASGE